MNNFRFSPIKSQSELLEAITYIHFSCHKLLKQKIGRYLHVAGNIGVFCHDEDEYKGGVPRILRTNSEKNEAVF